MSEALKLLSPDGDDDRAYLARLGTLTAAELRAELAACLGLSARALVRAAACWSQLERLGEDLSGIKDGFSLYLPHIAAGTVLPELVVGFARLPRVLAKLVTLTPADQRRVVDGEPVLLVVQQGTTFTHRMLPLRTLGYKQVCQVIGDGSIRTETEQVALLSSPPPKWTPGRPVKSGKATADPYRATVTIGRVSAPAVDVIKALRAAGMI